MPYYLPEASCTLTYTAGNTTVAETSFTIQGTNTNAVTATISIISIDEITLTEVKPSQGTIVGGTSVRLTGTGFSGTPTVTFGGVQSPNVTIVNSTTLFAVTPPHPLGFVDLTVNAPAGSATLVNGYEYRASVVGESNGGGQIACLGGGPLSFIVANMDASSGIIWGGSGIVTGAISTSDGNLNTTLIIAALGNNGGIPYAAQLCADYEADSLGLSPCTPGHLCYTDWFLPAIDQLKCIFANSVGQGYTNTDYWSSTEIDANLADVQNLITGFLGSGKKLDNHYVRCTRPFA
ncbi:MAG: IPT/TIG domain-containing protein [Legionella sp.]|nr:IPT/TIG domain-containing protein [Legionella sp.]